MSSLYAFCREVDDLADNEALSKNERRENLHRWREDLNRVYRGNASPALPVVQELQPFIEHHRLPQNYFDELLRGVEMDLDIDRYEDFPHLEEYCYRVASVVGLLSIEIFGYQHPETRDYAIALGKALQLTNILRDVGTDAAKKRIYLPLVLMRKHGVTEEDIFQSRYNDRFIAVAGEVADRARVFYREAHATLPAADRRAMVAAELMGSVYWKLLGKLEAQNFNVLSTQPTRLGTWHKALLIFRTWYRLASGTMVPNYGTS